MSLDRLVRKLDHLERELAMASGAATLLRKQQADTEQQLQRQRNRLFILEQVQALLLQASATARENVRSSLESLVSYALASVLGHEYNFCATLKQSAGSWTVEFSLVTPEGRIVDIMSQSGGGIIDICSVALRVAVLQMLDTGTGPLLLDEDFKFLSRDNIRAAVELLKNIVSKTGRQIILVTHIPEFSAYADNIIEVIPNGPSSQIISTPNPPQDRQA